MAGEMPVDGAAAADGVVTLEVTGSPGAVFPLASRIEALIRAAVPGITAVRLVVPGQGGSPPEGGGDLAEGGGDLAEAARRVLNAEVNPAISVHRGHVTVRRGGWLDPNPARRRLPGLQPGRGDRPAGH